FQPSVTVDKTGDTLSKIGDQVTYHFVINNTSSSDAPVLQLASITDDVLGNLSAQAIAAGCGSLASASSCNFNVPFTIPSGSADPLVNTVSVLYHPDGFPNDITASDSHSINLFQPSVAVDKVCTNEPVEAGKNAEFLITITNNSSADSPKLV